MSLLEIFNLVDSKIKTIDFNELWPGFHYFNFAIYNSKEICLEGKIIPYDKKFLGNTVIEYNDELTAIWGYENSFEDDIDIITSGIIHEMFHCYQREKEENRFPNDLILMMYPDSLINYQNKYQENKILINAYYSNDVNETKKLFSLFSGHRKFRESLIGKIIIEEYRAETFEGVAEYIGMMALKELSFKKFEKKLKENKVFLEASDKIFDIRRNSYFSGVFYFLILDKLGIEYKNYAFNCGKTFYELINYQSQNPNIISTTNEIIAKEFNAIIQKRKEEVQTFLSAKDNVVYNAVICGYDPMNMYRLNDYVYCKNFVFLRIEESYKHIKGPILLKMEPSSPNKVISYYQID